MVLSEGHRQTYAELCMFGIVPLEALIVLSPILHVVALQLIACHTATARRTDVDKPRNLAKSVTVE